MKITPLFCPFSRLGLSDDDNVVLTDRAAVTKVAGALDSLFKIGASSCEQALRRNKGHVGKTANFLANGGWITGPLTHPMPNWSVLVPMSRALSSEMRCSEERCLTVLRNCNGNLDVAKRRLSGQNALP